MPTPIETVAKGDARPETQSAGPSENGKSAELLRLVVDILDDAKAENIITIDLAGKTSIGDHMVVASGRSDRHVGAVADQLGRRLKDAGYGRIRIDPMTLSGSSLSSSTRDSRNT